MGGEYIHKEQIDNLSSSFIAGMQGCRRNLIAREFKMHENVTEITRAYVRNRIPILQVILHQAMTKTTTAKIDWSTITVNQTSD